MGGRNAGKLTFLHCDIRIVLQLECYAQEKYLCYQCAIESRALTRTLFLLSLVLFTVAFAPPEAKHQQVLASTSTYFAGVSCALRIFYISKRIRLRVIERLAREAMNRCVTDDEKLHTFLRLTDQN